MMFELKQHGRAGFAAEAKRILYLALPILVAQIAQVGLGVVDTVMAGRASTNDLAAVALGSNVFVTVYVTFLGVMAALQPILAQLFGAGKTAEVGAAGRQGLWFGLMLGLFGMVLLWMLAPQLQHRLNLGAYVDETFGRYVFWIALGMPAAMMHRALYAYAASLNRPKPIMVVSLLALLLNVPLNYVFVYGKLGLPAMGGAGCGLASALCFWWNALVLGWYVKSRRHFAVYGLFARFEWSQWKKQWNILRLGVPIGLSFFLEVSAFTFIGLLVARFGTTPVAAQQVVTNITSLLYMLPQSVGTALAVRVGQEVGAARLPYARYVSGVGLALGICGAVCTGLILLFFRHFWVSIYTSDATVMSLAAGILLFATVFQLSDAVQTIASYALRGYKLAKVPMLIHAVSFWGIGLGLGSCLGLWFGLGIAGFWLALVVSLTAAAIALVWYLNKQSRRLAGW